MKNEIPDGDYILKDGAAWLEAGGFAVRVRLDRGVMTAEIYRNGQEMEDPVAYAYAEAEGEVPSA